MAQPPEDGRQVWLLMFLCKEHMLFFAAWFGLVWFMFEKPVVVVFALVLCKFMI